MRKLLDGTNVDAATGDYPNGRTRDKDGATPGTILNEVLLGDIQQFFQKLLIDSGIAENDTPDNVSNGYQLLEALAAKIDELNGGLRTKIVDIGDWDMDATINVFIPHDIAVGSTKIRDVQVLIRKDSGEDDVIHKLDKSTSSIVYGSISWDDTNVTCSRTAGGPFDSTTYDETSYNRGWIVIRYLP